MTPTLAGLAVLLVGVTTWFRSSSAAPAESRDALDSPTARTSDARQHAPALIALGDSTAVGVGARAGSYIERLLSRIVKAWPRYGLANLSTSGATTRDVLGRQVPQIPEGASGLVMLGVGTNDLMRHVPPAEFARRFEAVLAGIRARTAAAIVVSNVPDVSLTPAIWSAVRPAVAARVDAYNEIIADLARSHGALVFDLCRMTREQLPAHPEYLSADGYHPSDLGYEAWAEGLWRVVRPIL